MPSAKLLLYSLLSRMHSPAPVILGDTKMNHPTIAFFGPPGFLELLILLGFVVVAIVVGVIVAVAVGGKGRTTSTNVPPPPRPQQDDEEQGSNGQ